MRKKFLGGFIAWVLALSASAAAGQQPGPVASGAPPPAGILFAHDVTVERQPVSVILQELLRGTQLPAGVVEIEGCFGGPSADLKVKQGTSLREAMDALVVQNPGYRWQFEGGAVNLEPRAGVPLLDTRIASFSADATEQAWPAILQDLMRLPEVQTEEARLGLEYGLRQGWLEAVEEHLTPKPVARRLNMQDISLRAALNKFVLAFGPATWIYREIDCEGKRSFIVQAVLGR